MTVGSTQDSTPHCSAYMIFSKIQNHEKIKCGKIKRKIHTKCSQAQLKAKSHLLFFSFLNNTSSNYLYFNNSFRSYLIRYFDAKLFTFHTLTWAANYTDAVMTWQMKHKQNKVWLACMYFFTSSRNCTFDFISCSCPLNLGNIDLVSGPLDLKHTA